MVYVPNHFKTADLNDVTSLVLSEGFGTLITGSAETTLHASQIPVEFILGSPGELLGHVARANPQSEAIETGCAGYAIVQGPHGYISPKWYDHENVPTWNYATVHFRGNVAALSDRELKDHLARLMAHHDNKFNVRGAFVDEYIPYILGFKLTCEDIVPAFKLSQDKSEKNKKNLISKLHRRSKPLDKALAQLMKQHAAR